MAVENAVETVVEEVALNLEETAQAVRLLNGRTASFGIGGLAIGLGIGLYFGYRYGKKKTKAEAMLEADREIEQMRDFYRNMVTESAAAGVLEGPSHGILQKPTLESIARERGYGPYPPETVDSDDPEKEMEDEGEILPPVPAGVRLPRPPVPVSEPSVTPEWNSALEFARRDTTQPYVIHRDEFDENANYRKLAYTYYDHDDVLVDDENNVVQEGNSIVGDFNFRWGYGSGDPSVVYVRNDQLQLDMEIQRRDASYEEAVLGLDPHDPVS